MTLRSEYVLLLRYLNLKQKNKPKALGIFRRSEIRGGTDKYAENKLEKCF